MYEGLTKASWCSKHTWINLRKARCFQVGRRWAGNKIVGKPNLFQTNWVALTHKGKRSWTKLL